MYTEEHADFRNALSMTTLLMMKLMMMMMMMMMTTLIWTLRMVGHDGRNLEAHN